MRQPDSKRIAELTEKLKSQGDITEQEADSIRSLFFREFAEKKLNPKSPKFDREMFNALVKFAETTLNLTKQGQSGMFVSSFPTLLPDFTYYVDWDIYEIMREIKDNLPLKDRIAIFNVSFDQPENKEKQPDIINKADTLRNIKPEVWTFLGHSRWHPSHIFWGYWTDRLGFFRRNNVSEIFKGYANIPVVSDPFLYFAAEFFFNESNYNIINTSNILSCAVISLINSKNIPFVIYGDIYNNIDEIYEDVNDIYEDIDVTESDQDNYIAVEAKLARKITQTVQKNEKHIIAEMKEKGVIRPLEDDRDVYLKMSEIEEKIGVKKLVNNFIVDERDWFEFDDYYKMIDLASNLLNETLKYGRTINRAREESAEEDIWIAEGR
jgi:hypothetical protein